ncbi:MAG: hypothetical protein OEV94_00475 [Deltaproteobacteria bacterium]|nr:hypothetical protein [Deltaproteobacteria bacterium]
MMKAHVTHDQVLNAIQKFQAQGGIIHKLPEQKIIRAEMLGEEKHNPFETLTNIMPM